MSLLEARELFSGYGETEILHGVSLHVERGEVVVLIGPNGAGKSTVMKTLFGLLRPTRGRVTLDGQDITGLPPHRLVLTGISYVPQTENVFPSLTIQENLEMGAFIRRDDFRPALRAVYERFPVLQERRRVRAGTLSGGERQMLAMGKALMLEPKLLLLDEPSAGLAPRLVEEIFAKVAQIAEGGVGVLIIEQNAKQALRIASRGYVMAMGEMRLEDAGATLLAQPDLGSLYLGA
jgi:branched-chain amino acid transport system ATP-binding protein